MCYIRKFIYTDTCDWKNDINGNEDAIFEQSKNETTSENSSEDLCNEIIW